MRCVFLKEEQEDDEIDVMVTGNTTSEGTKTYTAMGSGNLFAGLFAEDFADASSRLG